MYHQDNAHREYLQNPWMDRPSEEETLWPGPESFKEDSVEVFNYSDDWPLASRYEYDDNHYSIWVNLSHDDAREVLGVAHPNKRAPKTMNTYQTFRQAYNGCFAGGIATSESTSIHIHRAVTTLTPMAAQYRHMQIKVCVTQKDHSNNVTQLAHEHFPYGFFSHALFIGFSVPEQEDSSPEIVMNVNGNKSTQEYTHFYISYLESPATAAFIEAMKTHEFSPPISVTQIKSIASDGSVHSEEYSYNPKNAHQAHIEFYPFVHALYPEVSSDKLTIEHIVADFMSSKANLMLLVGPAGTAKSTLIRSFIQADHETVIVASAQVLESPALPNTFRSKPKNAAKRMVTVYEDADVFVMPREMGNLALSSMLNQLDGVLASEEKFIISTNLESLTKVDKALLRPGRCHKVIQFRELKGVEINTARAAVDMPPISTEVNLTLSEALNYKEERPDVRKPPAFGFASVTHKAAQPA